MFKLFRNRQQPSASSYFDEKTFYMRFCRDVQQAQSLVVIESPFLTVSRTRKLLSVLQHAVNRGVGVSVITREPDHHTLAIQYEAEQAVELLRRIGVRVFACSDMRHRKLAIIDNKIMWSGSLNILSQNKSRELMLRTTDAMEIDQVLKITQLLRDIR